MRRPGTGLAFVIAASAALAQDGGPGLNIHNATLGQLVEDCRRQTKKRFVYDEQISQGFMQRKIHIVSEQLPKNTDDYFAIFQTILQVNKLVLVPTGKPGEEVYKIVPAPTAQREAVPMVEETGAANDTYLLRIFKLDHVSVDEAHRALVNFTQPQNVVPVHSAGMVMVADYDYNIKRFEEIIRKIDKPRPDIDFKMIPLKRALANDVKDMLNNLVQALLVRQPRGQPGLPAMPGQEAIRIEADKRTNSLLVLAEKVRMDQVLDLVKQLDSEAPFETSGIYIVHLKHTNALDVVKTLNALYKISVDQSGVPSGGGTRLGQPVAPAAAGQPAGLGAGGSFGGSSLTGGEPTIVADARANSIIMITDRNTAKQLEALIVRLDQRRPQVLIQATVVEVAASDSFDLGVELARAVDPDNRLTSFLRAQYGQSRIVSSGNVIDIVPVDTTGLTLALVHDRIGNVGAMLKAVSEKGTVNILDQPEVATVDNGTATIKVSREVPVLSTTVTGTGVAQTVFGGFQEAKTTMTISPHISEGQYLRLDTSITIEKFVGVSPDPTIPPPKTSREINTTSILVPNGRTVVIGGIVTQDEADTQTKVPFFGDIPILGALFQRNQRREEKRTLYIFITPTILYDDQFGDLADLTKARVADIEKIRKSGLKNLMLKTQGDPVPVSAFRHQAPPEGK